MKKFLPKTQNNPQGFTLIELMVVIAIIAILSVVGVTVFGSVQKNARDARRKSDIDAIATALEVNKATTYVTIDGTKFAAGTVPVDSGNGATTATYCVSSNITATRPTAITTAWPNEPDCPSGYTSVTSTDVTMVPNATSWTVCASLENPATGSPATYCKSNSQ